MTVQTALSEAQTRPSPFHDAQRPVIAVALAVAALSVAHILSVLEIRLVWAFLIGIALGFALFRAAFGVTGAWRRFHVTGQSRGLRAGIAMLAAMSVTMMPLVTLGSYPASVAQVSVALMAGAFIFGFGMQLGGACGTGAAWVGGGGSARTWFTIAGLIGGSLIGSVHTPFWLGELPSFGAWRVTDALGPWGGLAATLAGLAGLWALARWRERRMAAAAQPPFVPAPDPLPQRLLLRPWAPFGGAIVIGLLATLTLVVTGAPWGITFGYTLWGAQLAEAMGADLATWTFPGDDRAFWAADWAQGALNASFFQNNSANMDLGLILGAMLAAALSGAWKPSLKGVSALSIFAALLGGALMGYGARMSFGCTIGALAQGVASGSLHGWIWMAFAFAGSVIGTRARPLFGLERL